MRLRNCPLEIEKERVEKPRTKITQIRCVYLNATRITSTWDDEVRGICGKYTQPPPVVLLMFRTNECNLSLDQKKNLRHLHVVSTRHSSHFSFCLEVILSVSAISDSQNNSQSNYAKKKCTVKG